MSASRALATLAGVFASLIAAPDVRACAPSAERVLAWDLGKDLVVVGVWPERERPPANKEQVPPGAFELRRISTGERIALRDCGSELPCEYRKILARDLPADVQLGQRSGKVFPGGMRVEETRTGEQYEIAFETRTRARAVWQRVVWVSVMPAAEAAQERRIASFAWVHFRDDEAMVSFQISARGGNCSYTFVRAMRMPQADLEDPRRKGRQAELLKRPPRKDDPFEYWRTLAELGPLPADRVIEAMEAAGHDAQIAFAVRWWRDATRGLGRKDVAQLAEGMKGNPALSSVRSRLGL